MFSAAIYWQHCLQVAKEKSNQRETPFPLLPSISHIVHLFACKWLRRKPTSVRPHVLNCHLLATLCIYLRKGGWGEGQPAWDPIFSTAIYWQHYAFICLQVVEEKANQRETPFPLLPSIGNIVHLFACRWLRRRPTSVRPTTRSRSRAWPPSSSRPRPGQSSPRSPSRSYRRRWA